MKGQQGGKVPAKAPRVRFQPKGRQVDPKAREEIRALLGNDPRRRDLLPPMVVSFLFAASTAITISLCELMKLPLGTGFDPYVFSTLSNVTFLSSARPALMRSPTLGACVLGSWPRNFAVVLPALASRIALTTYWTAADARHWHFGGKHAAA